MTEKLRISSIQIRDVLGAREFSMETGKVTVLRGRNASGKTTALSAIQSAVGGGNLANLARIGNEDEEIDPEIVLVLDGDTEKYLVKKTTKGTHVRKQVGDSAGFEDVPQPQRWLSGLYDTRLANPIKFLHAADKDRILILLGALNVTLDRDALWASMGINKKDVGAVPEGLHPLQELALIRESVFRERTGVNRDATQKVATAEQTRRATPAVLPDDHEAEIKSLEVEITAGNTHVAKCTAGAKHTYSEMSTNIRTAADTDSERKWEQFKVDSERHIERFEADMKKQRAELEARIAREEQAIEKDIGQKDKLVAQEVHNLETARDETLLVLAGTQRAIDANRIKLAELREQAKSAVKAQTLYDQAEQFDKEAEALQAISARLTAAIDAVDAYRRGLADNLPIPGLEIDGKVIKVDGIPFDQLNMEKKIDLAVSLACLRAADQTLPIIWLDGAEALDRDNFKQMCTRLQGEDVQAFLLCVDDGDLTVEREG